LIEKIVRIAAHDLARSGLGQVRGQQDLARSGDLADLLGEMTTGRLLAAR